MNYSFEYEFDGAAEMLAGAAALDKVRNLLQHFRSAMLTTVSGSVIHTRPMGLLQKPEEFAGTLWFFASEYSLTAEETRHGVPTSLVFQCDQHNSYLQLSGRTSMWRDRAQMQRLYTPLLHHWFPDGLDDPDLVLLRFDAHGGHYWDAPGGVLRVLGALTRLVANEPR